MELASLRAQLASSREALTATLPLDPGTCELWHDRWRSVRSHARFIQFVHNRKAAGHYVERWLWDAHYGNAHNMSGRDKTSDLHFFAGGHHSFNSRHWRHQQFITVVREPLERMASHYNDIHGFLSVPNVCHNGSYPSYCSAAHVNACKERTGWNTEAMHKYAFEGASPCVPRLSFYEQASGETSWPGGHNQQFKDVVPHFDWRANASEQLAMLRRDLRSHYLVVGVATRDSTAAFVERLRYAFDTPYAPHLNSSYDGEHNEFFLEYDAPPEVRPTVAAAAPRGTRSSQASPSEADLLCYGRQYPDVRKAYGHDIAQLRQHWQVHGKAEGRTLCGGEPTKHSANGKDETFAAASPLPRPQRPTRPPRVPTEQLFPGFVRPPIIAKAAELTADERQAILAQEHLDLLVYAVIREIDDEQRRCFDMLPESERRPPTIPTSKGIMIDRQGLAHPDQGA